MLIKAHGDSIHARRILERGRKPSPESRHRVQKGAWELAAASGLAVPGRSTFQSTDFVP